MKKLISIICILSMLLALTVGCSSPGDDGNDDGGGDVSGEGMTDSEKNKLTLAKELAGEVDQVRSFTSAISGSSNTVVGGGTGGKESAGGGFKPTKADISYTEKVAFTRDENALDKEQGATNFDWADDIVSKLKQEKNQALSVCKCLNTWVKLGDGPYSAVYRMNYDTNTGTVTVEYHSHLSDFNSYRRFTVTLDASGKAVIDSFSASYNEEYITSSTELHYYEDKYYFSLYQNRGEDGHVYENTVFLDLENKTQAFVGVNSSTYYENGVPVRTEYGDPSISFQYTDGNYLVNSRKDGGSLAYASSEGFASGGYIGSVSATGLMIDLNVFEGWSTVSREGDNVILNTTEKGAISSLGFTGNSLGTENGVTYSYRIPYYDTDTTAHIWMDFGGGEGVSTKDKIRGAFTVIENELGLTMDNSLMEKLISTGDRHGELSAQFHFKNGVYAKDIATPEDYFALLGMMRTDELTLGEIKGIYDGNGINQSEQDIENTYFEFLDFTFSGSASIAPATGDITLTDIRASIMPSLLMKDGGEYSLVFAWSAPGALVEAGSVSLTYGGKALEFVSNVTSAFEARPLDYGEYRLVAYVALKNENRHERISKLIDVKAAAAAEFSGETDYVKSELTASTSFITLKNTAKQLQEQ